MPNEKKTKTKRAPASRRLQTRSTGPAVSVVRTGGRLLLPHERDEAAIAEPQRVVARHRKLVRQALRDVEHGLVDTEARGTPSNVPVERAPTRRRANRGSE